ELDFDSAELVGPDLFAGRSDDDGGLRARNDRFGRFARRPERDIVRNAGEGIAVRLIRVLVGLLGVVPRRLYRGVFDAGEHVLRVHRAIEMAGELEAEA